MNKTKEDLFLAIFVFLGCLALFLFVLGHSLGCIEIGIKIGTSRMEKKAIQYRNARIRGDNFPVKDVDYLEPLRREISAAMKRPETNPRKKSTLRFVCKLVFRFE
jgi:hypothetical protein